MSGEQRTEGEGGVSEVKKMDGKKDVDPLPSPVNVEESLKRFMEEKEQQFSPMEITRDELMGLLVEKHRLLASLFEKELDAMKNFLQKNESEVEELRKKRDTLNTLSRELREKREHLHSEMRGLRRQFFSLFESEERLEKEMGKTADIQKEIERYEWKLQTEAVTLEKEREYLAHIKDLMDEIERLNAEYRKKPEIEKEAKRVAEELGKKTVEADSIHTRLLEVRKEADETHEMYVKLANAVGRAKRRAEWLSHMVERHQEAADYWESRLRMEKEKNGGAEEKKGEEKSADGGGGSG